MDTQLTGLTFDIGPIRPPSEGQDRSLLVRLTRNCPWNKCTFCTSYKNENFHLRPTEEILGDIETISSQVNELTNIRGMNKSGGPISDAVLGEYVRRHHDLFDEGSAGQSLATRRWHCLTVVAEWLRSGGKTVFLQDADSLIMPIDILLGILGKLRSTFPSIQRITSYARARTISHRSLADMEALKGAGLSRLHLGMESGSNDVLAHVNKGINGEIQVKAGRLVKQSGIELSEYVIPGLGGHELSDIHASETARVLNQIKPDFIRFRSLVLKPGMSLFEENEAGVFKTASEDQMVDEISQIIRTLDFPVRIASDHISNLFGEVEGDLPDEKAKLLKIIDDYRSQPLQIRQMTQLRRRLQSSMAVSSGIDSGLEKRAIYAYKGLRAGSPCDEGELEDILVHLKRAFI